MKSIQQPSNKPQHVNQISNQNNNLINQEQQIQPNKQTINRQPTQSNPKAKSKLQINQPNKIQNN